MREVPSVGVVIPCYNGDKTVIRAIESAVCQTDNICIIDDKSTDNSVSIIKKYLSEKYTHGGTEEYDEYFADVFLSVSHNQIIFIRMKKNKGKSASRNIGIDFLWNYCELFCPLDADDTLLSGKLEFCAREYIKERDNIGLVYNDVIIHDERSSKHIIKREFRIPYNRKTLESYNMIPNASVISKKALESIKTKDGKFYDESLNTCEDYDLWLRITENFIAIHIPEAMQEYYLHGDNCTIRTKIEEINKDRLSVMNKIRRGQLNG
jgi:glycosyltransferase involved in cell wall biosynthesis